MKRKELSRLIAGALTATVVLNSYSGNTKTVSAATKSSSIEEADGSSDLSEQSSEITEREEVITEEESVKNVEAKAETLESSDEKESKGLFNKIVSLFSETGENVESKFIYLSDLTMDSKSSSDWGFKTNTNPEGGTIKLLVNGKPTLYTKGIGAYANATLVYDVSSYSNKYPVLIGYLGVDYSQKDYTSADGVDYTVEVSDDGEAWRVVDDIGMVKASQEAYRLNVNIEGVKYVKISALHGANNSYDHAVLGNLRLAESDYDISGEVDSSINFSFSGDNANKIIVNTTRTDEIKYSLDGGVTWVTPSNIEENESSKVIPLTEDEVSSITSSSGIRVKIGIYEYSQNISSVNAPNSGTVYGNDLEDRLIGNTAGLEYRVEGANEWKDYTSETKFEGAQVIEVRYKAHDSVAASAITKYAFKESTNIATRTYIPLSNITLDSYCSQENNGYSDASNMLDGNANTMWHNRWGGEDNLFYTVKFNEVKYLSSIEYLPQTGGNGRLRNGEIWVSFDGEDWTLAGTFKDLQNNTNLQTINLPESIEARYVKIQATSTWGSPANRFFTGRMLNFYEDTTKERLTEPVIRYSTTKNTNNYVIATLTLPEGCKATEKSYKFLENGTHDFIYTDSDGETQTIKAEVTNITKISSEKGVYLSDLTNESLSYDAWNGIQKDKNPSGNSISVMINGEKSLFNKGLGIHAPSTVVYDIEAYAKDYPRFSAYLGVDASRGGNGSVRFTISASKDGKSWDVLKTTGTMNGNSPAEYVNLDVRDYVYLKLYADSVDTAANDHSVYADARLIKESYDISGETLSSIKRVAEYDEIIKSTYSENTEIEGEFKQVLLKRTFVNRYGYSAIQQYAQVSPEYREAIEYILNNDSVMEYFVTGGEIDGGSYARVLDTWCKLYAQYKSDFFKTGYLKMAVALSIVNSKGIVFWTGGGSASDPVVRYGLYKQLIEEGLMDKGGSSQEFFNQPIELMRWVMDNMIHDDEIMWLMEEVQYRRSLGKDFKDAYEYISYTSGFNYSKSMYHSNALYDGSDPKLQGKTWYEIWNEKWDIAGLSDYTNTNMHRLWMVFQDGSVCGGLAKTYTNIGQLFGKPATVCGQPGHAVSLEYNYDGSHRWTIQNDISGWMGTEKGERMPLGWGSKDWDAYYNVNYILLTQRAFNDYDNLVKAMYYNYLADVYKGDNEARIKIYERALSVQSFNLDSMVGLINCYKADSSKTSADFTALARRVIEAYTFYPQQMLDVLNLLKAKITDSSDIAEVDLLRTNALFRATQATASDCAQPNDCKGIARALLGNNSTELATFSFDGVNAGKIVINEKYETSNIRVRYSLDGGNNWKESGEHIITLSDEEIASITSANNIIVGLVGTEATFTIDIKDGVQITNSVLYKSDLENRFIGDTTGLQFSLDGCETWCEYTPSIRFTGDVQVKVRYKPKGVYLGSNIATYTFTADNNTDKRTYISIDHISLAGFSNEQNNTSNAAKNMIDANDNTGWHTKYSYTTKDKFYTVKLDEVKFISAVEYLPGGQNGRLKDAEVYTSYDGVNWTLSATANSLANNGNLKKIEFEESVPARYIKIVAKNTYGNSTWETNMYFSGLAFNFYEDTTKVYNGDPIVTYSTTETTNHYVDAKLVLAEGCEATELTHRFTENGSYEFHYTKDGVEKTVIATVDNIVRDLNLTSIYVSDLNYEKSSFSGWNGIRKDLAPSGSKINIKVDNNKKQFEKGIGAHTNSEVLYDISMFSDSYNKFQAYVGVDSASPSGSVSFKILASKNGEDWDELKTTNTLTSSSNAVFVDVNIEGYSYLKLVADGVDNTDNDHAVYADAKLVRDKAMVKYFNGDGKVTANLLLPDEFEAISDSVYEFTINETHTFEYTDSQGQLQTIDAIVDWLDSTTSEKDENIDQGFGVDQVEDPDISEKDENIDPDFGIDQVEDPDTSEKDENIDPDFGVDSTDDKDIANGEFDGDDSFLRPDGNATPDKDDNIDDGYLVEDTRDFEVQFDNPSLTNKNVVATLVNLHEGDVVEGGNSYTFESNGKHTFVITDSIGNRFEKTVEVNWIDKEAPSATIMFDYSKSEEGIVIAKLVDFTEEGVKILNPSDGKDYYEFKTNGSFTFEFVDEAGNVGKVTANVDWFEFKDLFTLLTYSSFIDGKEVDSENGQTVVPDYVVAKLDVDTEKVQILNNDGSNEVKFVKNGEFRLKVRMIETGEEFDILVKVDCLAETAGEDESPVELPEGTDTSDDSTSEKDPNIDDGFGIDKIEDPSTSEKDPNIDSDFGVDKEEDPSTSDKDENIDPDFGVVPPVKPNNGNGSSGGNGNGGSSNGSILDSIFNQNNSDRFNPIKDLINSGINVSVSDKIENSNKVNSEDSVNGSHVNVSDKDESNKSDLVVSDTTNNSNENSNKSHKTFIQKVVDVAHNVAEALGDAAGVVSIIVSTTIAGIFVWIRKFFGAQ